MCLDQGCLSNTILVGQLPGPATPAWLEWFSRNYRRIGTLTGSLIVPDNGKALAHALQNGTAIAMSDESFHKGVSTLACVITNTQTTHSGSNTLTRCRLEVGLKNRNLAEPN